MYLSFVVSANNRGYAGNFIERFQKELDTIYVLSPTHGLSAEIVIVDWNTPSENLPVKDVIDWSKASIPTRVVRVPPSVHDSLSNPHNLNFFECIAKNTGVRRSNGEFVLTMNADSIYSDEMIARLAKHNLDENCFYRTNRVDIDNGKVVKINYWNESVPPGIPPTEPPMFDYDFGRIPRLHFNASGEFTLMSKSKWFEIQGHPEVPFNCVVDGYMIYLAARHGLKQVILPEAVYHQEHFRDGCDQYRFYCPPWSDEKPYSPPTTADWGLPNHNLEITTIL